MKNPKNDYESFLSAVVAVCPYLLPCIKGENLHTSIFEAKGVDNISEIAELCIAAQELIRKRMPLRLECQQTPLVCINIILEFVSFDVGSELGEAYVSIAHEVLREVFLPYGVMFGKFWRSETVVTVKGVTLPSCPVTFLSIRPSVFPADKKFLDERTLEFAKRIPEQEYPFLSELAYKSKVDFVTQTAQNLWTSSLH